MATYWKTKGRSGSRIKISLVPNFPCAGSKLRKLLNCLNKPFLVGKHSCEGKAKNCFGKLRSLIKESDKGMHADLVLLKATCTLSSNSGSNC